MKIIGEAELKKQIGKGELAPVYFLYGSESFLKQNYVNQIIRKAVTAAEDFNLQKFDGAVKIQELYDAVSQYPLMSRRKCVTVCDFHFEQAPASELSQLEQLLSEPFESCVLVFWFDLVEIDVKKSAKVKKVMGWVEKAGGVLAELLRKTTAELVKILCDGASRRGCRMEPTTARYLIETCSNDLQILGNELQKLCAYTGGGPITNETVDRVSVRSVDVSVFQLAKALTAGNAAGAMSILDDLFFQRVEPVVILNSLAMPYVDMYRAKAAEAAGLRAESVADDFGYRGTAFRLKNAAASARRLSAEQLHGCLQILQKADGLLKGSRSDPRTVLEEVVVQLLLAGSGGAAV